MVKLSLSKPGEREFPKLRAHVYYAAPGETLKSVLAGLTSLQPICDIRRIILHGDVNTATRSALVELTITPNADLTRLAFDALPLGPNHTRLVIRWLAAPSSAKQGDEIIRSIQAATDAILIGG